jgi:hypothetical protein
MSQIVEVGEDGSLRLPPELLEPVRPHTRFVVQRVGEMLTLRPEGVNLPFWATATPEERAADFLRWMASIRAQERGPALPAEALSRENIYE